MNGAAGLIDTLGPEERDVFFSFASFPDYFSVDWLPHHPPSRLMAVVQRLGRAGWIVPKGDEIGFFTWTGDFPKGEVAELMGPDEWAARYRKAVDVLSSLSSQTADTLLTLARLSLRAGLRAEDLDFVLRAAQEEQNRHKISSAIDLYDAVLNFMESSAAASDADPPPAAWQAFVTAGERRVALSLFHPDVKRLKGQLMTAIKIARRLGDVKAEAFLELLIGQNHWMYFQYEDAVCHFQRGWEIIEGLEDEELRKWGLKVRGLTYIIQGRFFEAIEAYEQSLGELESADGGDFFHLVGLNLALCYTQVGMPQRGLGITEIIQSHCRENNNRPLLSYALVTAGIILLELKKLKNSRSYFERALALAREERIPMVEVLAGIGLASIECQLGNFAAAAEHYKVLWRIRKSSWYHILNFYPLLDTGYILHSQGASPIDLRPVFDFLCNLKQNEVNPLMYGMIQRLQLRFLKDGLSPGEKIAVLEDLERTVEEMGATFELAKIRVELARLFNQTRNWEKAEFYARKAYEFFEPIAKDCFPPDLHHLVPYDQSGDGHDRLYDLIIEMGEALTSQDNIEKLLTNIITSLSRLMGSERIILFIKTKDSDELAVAASRNLLVEEIKGPAFAEAMSNIKAAAADPQGRVIWYEARGLTSDDYRRVIITPLKLGRRIIGVLYQDSRYFVRDFTKENVKLFSALASQIAVTIDRAQAYDEIARLNKRLIQENLYYLGEMEELQPFGEIIGVSEGIRTVRNLIRKVAPTQSSVLIHGETGVGKELVARAIHRESPRRGGPFIRVNCAAFPETLIDTELFGHEKGAFTGAVRAKEGRFELADGGTLFLDEVSELPLATQSRLLRVLQEKEFQRVGGTKTLKSDFRLISATNVDLEKAAAAGRFRSDLFFRLNVFPIYVPPLRERVEDIPHLALHFLKIYCSQSKRDYPGIPESEMAKLQAYPWPGNIRELSNMIERAVILGGETIRFRDLGNDKTTRPPARRRVTPNGAADGDTLEDIERRHILEVLERCGGRLGGKNGAAERLGLNRTTLIYRMKKLGIALTRRPEIGGQNT